jgi:two-component system sensor histidine kinase YesM
MPLREKLILFVITLLVITTLALTLVWYHDSNFIMNSWVEETASSLMRDAYDAFSYLLTDAEYLSSLVIMNREHIITPLQVINAEAKKGASQFSYDQYKNKRIIDSYISSMYGHKYYITGISVVSASGYLFKTGAALYYPHALISGLGVYGVSESGSRMVLLPPVDSGSPAGLRGQFIVPAVRSITNLEGESVGFVIVYFDYAVIREIFSDNLPEGSIFTVTDNLENIIFSNTQDKEGADGRFYVRSSYYAEKAGWKFDMAIPTSGMRGKINRTIQRALAIMAVIAFTAIGAGVLAVYRMTRNLEKLKAAMLDVSRGNLDSRAGIGGTDEIGGMGKIFDGMVGDIKDLLERVSMEERRKRKTEIDFLQAQINPHFVANTLNTITWMANMSNAANIASLTKSLASLMQSSMRRGSRFISIGDEIEYTRNYVEIQKYSAFYDFKIDFTVRDGAESLFTPRVVLHPLVENAIIHCLSHEKDEQKIAVSAFRSGDAVHIEVFDNGRGMEKSRIEELMGEKKTTGAYSSIGIKNIRERIMLFFGKDYGLSFESVEDQYTRAILVIPVLSGEGAEEIGQYE